MIWLNKFLIAINNTRLLADEKANKDTVTNVGNDVGLYIMSIIESYVPIVLGVVAGLGILYSIVIAIKMARADDAQKREEAKKKLLWVLIATAVLIVLFVFFQWAFPAIMSSLGYDYGNLTDTGTITDPVD